MPERHRILRLDGRGVGPVTGPVKADHAGGCDASLLHLALKVVFPQTLSGEQGQGRLADGVRFDGNSHRDTNCRNRLVTAHDVFDDSIGLTSRIELSQRPTFKRKIYTVSGFGA